MRCRQGERHRFRVGGLGEAADSGFREASGAEVGLGSSEELVIDARRVELIDVESEGWAERGEDAGEEGLEEVVELRRDEVACGGADEDNGGEEGGDRLPVPYHLHTIG